MLSFYFFYRLSLALWSPSHKSSGNQSPQRKKQNRIQEAFWTIQRILPDRQNFHPVGAEGFYTVRIRISLERGQYRHMWEIVYDNVVPFDRIQSFMTRLGVMTQGRVRDNFKWFLRRVNGKIILEKLFKR